MPTEIPSLSPTFRPDVVNVVTYNGYYYSTLGDTDIYYELLFNCQSSYLSLPAGWSIAPENADSIAIIAKYPWSNTWLMVASGQCYGTTHYPNNEGVKCSYCSSSLLVSADGFNYKPSICTHVLIAKKIPSSSPSFAPTAPPTSAPSFNPTFTPTAFPTCIPTSFPTLNPTPIPTTLTPSMSPTIQPMHNVIIYNGLSYSTMGDVDPYMNTVAFLCQGYLSLPAGWSIAADNADSIAMITAYSWSALNVVVSNGNSYDTAAYGKLAGHFFQDRQLVISGNTYKPARCPLQILITASL